MVNPRRWLHCFFLACCGSVFWPVLGQAQTPEFHDRTEVVSGDVMVHVEPALLGRFASYRKLRRLTTADFVIRSDGAALTLTGVEGPWQDIDPWRLVIYFDLTTSSTRTVRWAAGLLAQHSRELLRLGPVDLLLADEHIKPMLIAAESSDILANALSRVALLSEGKDTLAASRGNYLDGSSLDGSFQGGGGNNAGSVGKALLAEGQQLMSLQDELLLYLEQRAANSGPRRALLWISDGFDEDPQQFYSAVAGAASVAADEDWTSLADSLADSTADWRRSLAAYGWITLTMSPPPPDPSRGKARGVRVGKWRFLGLGGVYEADRDPQRAENYLELGQALEGQNKLQAAADAYDKAYYHFWGDPETASRQAVALAALARMLSALERPQEARRAADMARTLDPAAIVALTPGLAAANLRGAEELLQSVADQTGGHRIRHGDELSGALVNLAERLRLSFQSDSADRGVLLPLTVAYGEQETPLTAPAWTRSGTPCRVAEARLRQLRAERQLYAERPSPGGELKVELLPATAGGFEIRTDARGPIRLAIAAVDELGWLQIACRDWSEAPEPLIWNPADGGSQPRALLVEELASGRYRQWLFGPLR